MKFIHGINTSRLRTLITEIRQFKVSKSDYEKLAQIAFRRSGQAIEKAHKLKKQTLGSKSASDYLSVARAHAHAMRLQKDARDAALELNRPDLAATHDDTLATLKKFHRRHDAKGTALLPKV